MGKFYSFLDERLSISEMKAFASKKKVPLHRHSYWYYWGGISLLCFIVQAVTGILLLIYYKPGPEAYDSVRQITYDIHFGWLIRSAHNWSATLFLISVFVHMFSVFFMKSYRKPREFGWWSGVLLLLLGLTFGFSGYLLPMEELSYFATKVGLATPEALPLIGKGIANLLRGGLEVSDVTVQRFFALHVVILPLLYLPLLGFHLWLVQKHGNALPPSEDAKPEAERKSIPFFPNFLAKDLGMWLMTLNAIAIMASLFPPQLGKPGDPLSPAPAGIHPEWYFMSPFATLKIIGRLIPGTFGEAAGMTLFAIGLILWFIVPFYDIKTKGGLVARKATYFGIFVVAVLVITTFYGYVAA
jgi:quinol-cytochrome oxidoreductase complex cytochrome b subunit